MQNYSTEQQVGQSISSERLRKAIERNRAKQLKRSRTENIPPSRPPVAPPPLPQDLTEKTMRFNSHRTSTRQLHQSKLPPKVNDSLRPHRTSFPGTRSQFKSNFQRPMIEKTIPKKSFFDRFSKVADNIRKTVGRVGEIEFAGEIRKGKKAPASPVYITKKNSKNVIPEKWIEKLVIAGWLFCTFVFFRLVFADRGVIDYYKKKGVILQRDNVYKSIEDDNLIITTEIEKITTDEAYQKKIVRDHLGFIAQNEYLIMFAGEH